MKEYELVLPFDIDDGELDGISPEECFALGVEWANIRGMLNTALEHQFQGGTITVRAANAQRICRLADRLGAAYSAYGDPSRTIVCSQMPTDATGWVEIRYIIRRNQTTD